VHVGFDPSSSSLSPATDRSCAPYPCWMNELSTRTRAETSLVTERTVILLTVPCGPRSTRYVAMTRHHGGHTVQGKAMELKDYGKAFRRWWWLLILAALLGGAA